MCQSLCLVSQAPANGCVQVHHHDSQGHAPSSFSLLFFLLCGACLWSWWCGTWTVRTLTLHAGQYYSFSYILCGGLRVRVSWQRKEETETWPWPISSYISFICDGATDVSCFPFLSLPHYYFLGHPPHYVSLTLTNICAVDVVQKIKRWGRVFFFSLSAIRPVSGFTIHLNSGRCGQEKKEINKFLDHSGAVRLASR